MIKFFRKIRQKLLTVNKFSKYLIYATGEIILVVIGILIALQVNNLNEQRKQRKVRDTYYLSMINSFDNDLKEIEDYLEFIEASINNINEFKAKVKESLATKRQVNFLVALMPLPQIVI